MTYRQYIKKGHFDQNGEWGCLVEACKRLKITRGKAVEFGAPTKTYCSNIAQLPPLIKRNYFDSNPQEEGITKAFITPENVNELIGACDILSIDIDGGDLLVWAAYIYDPKIVVIEINSSIDPEVEHFSMGKGSSFKTMNLLAEKKGYFLLCHTGNNIYIRNDYKHLFKDADSTFDKSWL